MRVADTSIWIEWLINSALSQSIAEIFPETTDCIVPTIVQLELCKWLTREVGEAEADQVIAYTQNCAVATLELQAEELPYHLSLCLNSTSYRHGLPVSRTHGCDQGLAIHGFWIPAIPCRNDVWTFSLN